MTLYLRYAAKSDVGMVRKANEDSGFAGRSQDVPAWVNRFKQTPSLAGKQFGELTLSRDKEGRLAFQLSGIEREKP